MIFRENAPALEAALHRILCAIKLTRSTLARNFSVLGSPQYALGERQLKRLLGDYERLETQIPLVRTLALLHAATGLRPAEALGLKWEDAFWTKDQIHVRRGW